MSKFTTIPIVEAAIKCGIMVSLQPDKVEVQANCPFCNDKKRHMSLNTQKNVFYCHRCNESGNSITLYAKLIGIDYSTAYKELKNGYVSNTYPHCSAQEREPKPLMERHKVYNELLQMLDLYGRHKDNLLKRGLNSIIIKHNMYRSVPAKSMAERIAESLSEKYDLTGIPGFYTACGKWHMTLADGIFIPVRNQDNYIQGMQIRLDNAKRNKYCWFSSRFMENGARACSWIHVSNWNGSNTAFITEGALKADVASYLSGNACFMGLPGVNCTSGLLPVVKRMGINKVYECFDMDKKTNKHVADAAALLRNKIVNEGISCRSYEWDRQFNGIDDYYVFCKWLDEAS